MPNDMQAGVYSATVHYLKAVQAPGDGHDGRAVVAKMKDLPTDDPPFGKGVIRADGRTIHRCTSTRRRSRRSRRATGTTSSRSPPCLQIRRSAPLNAGGCPLVKG